jgi:hypothetical protein
MPYPRPDPDLCDRVERAVDWLVQEAGVDRSGSIVPLVDLVEAAPSTPRYQEVHGLTHAVAARTAGERTGQDSPLVSAPDAPLDGAVFVWEAAQGPHPYRSLILVNADHRSPVERRRFTVAHELGHLVLHVLRRDLSRAADGPAPGAFVEGLAYDASDDTSEGDARAEVGVDEQPLDAATVAALETEADAFAAALLMPGPTVADLVDRYAPRYGDRRDVLARRLATDLLVSKSAMRRRLHTLGLGR